MKNLSNITISDFRKALLLLGLSCDGVRGGHEKWSREGMERPVIFQTHKEPIPVCIVMNNLRNIGISKKDFLALLENNKK